MPLKNSIQELGQILKLITAFEQELRALLVIFQSFGKLMLFCINFHKIGWSNMGEKSLSSFLLQVEILKVKHYQKHRWTKIPSSFMSCVFQVWVYQFSCLTLGEDSVWVKMRVHLWENLELSCSVCLFPTLSSHIWVSSCPQHHMLSGNPFPAGLSWELDSSRSIDYSGLF